MSLAELVKQADQQQQDGNSAEEQAPSIHGEQAARRKANTELIFFAGVNDVQRCQYLVKTWNIKVSEYWCADYDKRTPLHIACAEGAFSTANWLLEQGARVNALDRFEHTALEEAALNDHVEIIKLLQTHGGKILEKGELINIQDSRYMSVVNFRQVSDFGIDADWEIDPKEIQLGDMIGEGEFGQVFQANWHGTEVAVKVLKRVDKIAIEDFRTEVSVLSKVHHPNAVQFLGAVTKSQPYMLITELMICSIAWVSRQMYTISLGRIVKLALDFARGMAYLHLHPPQIIHRDLKPGNLMIGGNTQARKRNLVCDSGVLKIADFGLSKTLKTGGNEKSSDRYKMTGETGSYRYMSPEVFRHEPYNFKVDVYSFSMIIFELLFQQPPFSNLGPVSAAEAAAMHQMRPTLPTPDDDIHKQLFELLERCWHADPDARPDFQEIISELLAIQSKYKKSRAGRKAEGGQRCVCNTQ